MAIIKLSGLVTRISGKFQGMVFGYSTNGSYIKSNAWSLPQNSPAQSRIQFMIQTVSSRWNQLTLAQKATFTAEVGNYTYTNKVGESANYNAYQIFLFLNNNLLQSGEALIVTAPVFVAVVNSDMIIATSGAGTLDCDYTTGVVGTTAAVFCSPQINIGLEPNKSSFIFVQEITMLGGVQTISIKANYESVFTTLKPGKVIWMRFKTTVTSNGNTTDFSDMEKVLVV